MSTGILCLKVDIPEMHGSVAHVRIKSHSLHEHSDSRIRAKATLRFGSGPHTDDN